MLRPTNVEKIFNAVTVLAGGYAESEIFDFRMVPEGYFGLQWSVGGDGICDINIYSSINGADFINVSDAIATGQTKTTGDGGKNLVSFESEVCTMAKVRVTETGGVNPITISAWLKAY